MFAQLIETATALGIATAVILVGAHGLRQAPIWVRFAAGLAVFVGGVWLAYPLALGDAHPLDQPFRLGFAAGLVGLGINQMAAPLRIASGRAA